jgi:hypothetical protein
MTGMHKRMGNNQRPDRALSIEAILLLDEMLMKEIEFARRSRNMPGLEEAIMLGFYVTIGFCGGLRGEEIVMAHYKGIKEKYEESINNANYPFVMLTLLGQFKGKTGDRFHWQPLALRTASGIDIKYWFDQLVDLFDALGICDGWVFRDQDNRRAKTSCMRRPFIERLERIQQSHPDVIPANVNVPEEVGMSWSLRRSSDAQAIRQGIDPDIINRNNRWKQVEAAKGKKVRRQMMEHYADVALISKSLCRYSAGL